MLGRELDSEMRGEVHRRPSCGSGAMSTNDLCDLLVYGLVMLDVRRLRVLREVARRGSFSAAAEALSFTQPAISRQIAALELEAGAKLVDRSTRGVRLTPCRRLAGRARRRDPRPPGHGQTQLEALAGLAGGRLRLGTFGTANATLIPLAIRTVSTDAHPAVELRLVEGWSATLVARTALPARWTSPCSPSTRGRGRDRARAADRRPAVRRAGRRPPAGRQAGAAHGRAERGDVDRKPARRLVGRAGARGRARRGLRAVHRLRGEQLAGQAGPSGRGRGGDARPERGGRHRARGRRGALARP